MMHDSFSVLFMLTVCGWLCRLDSAVCVFVCVWQREEVELNCRPGKSDCVKLLVMGRWGWVGVRGEGAGN